MFNLIVFFLIAKYVLYRMSRDDYEKNIIGNLNFENRFRVIIGKVFKIKLY